MWSRWWHGEGLAVPLSRAVCAPSRLPPSQRPERRVVGGVQSHLVRNSLQMGFHSQLWFKPWLRHLW